MGARFTVLTVNRSERDIYIRIKTNPFVKNALRKALRNRSATAVYLLVRNFVQKKKKTNGYYTNTDIRDVSEFAVPAHPLQVFNTFSADGTDERVLPKR